MYKMSKTHHPITTSAKFSSTVKSATMILQIYKNLAQILTRYQSKTFFLNFPINITSSA